MTGRPARTSAANASDTVFLVNPASANGSTGRRWPEIARTAAAHGLTGDTLFSQRPGQLSELAAEAARDGAKLLVVVGGDGSVNEVANGIAGLDGVEIAVIARGTGWDFVRTYEIPRKVEAAVDVALNGRTREIDLGRAHFRRWDGTEQKSYFANIASAGMSGAIRIEAVLAAMACAAVAAGQRALSTPVRRLRRGVQDVHGELILADGTTEPLDGASIRAAPEAALRWFSLAMPLLAAALLVTRLV